MAVVNHPPLSAEVPSVTRVLAVIASGNVAGFVAGLIAGGVGSRLAMRILALSSPDAQGATTEAQEIVGEISLEGTLFLLAVSALLGVGGGLAYRRAASGNTRALLHEASLAARGAARRGGRLRFGILRLGGARDSRVIHVSSPLGFRRAGLQVGLVGMSQSRLFESTRSRGTQVNRIILIVYLVVGVIVASAQGYLGEIDSVGDALNLLLAVVLWPLLLVGVDFNIRIGDNGGRNRNNGLLPLAGVALAYLRTVAQPGRSERTG